MGVFQKEASVAQESHKEVLKAREEAKRQKEEKEAALRAERDAKMQNSKICDITDEEAAQIIKEEEEKYVGILKNPKMLSFYYLQKKK